MRIDAKYERKWNKKYGQDVEIAAEKRPRLAQRDKWVEQERQRTKLPKTGLQEDAPKRPVAAVAQSDIGDEAVGRKKNKRMAVLTKKRAQAAQKEATKAKQQHSEAQEAVA